MTRLALNTFTIFLIVILLLAALPACQPIPVPTLPVALNSPRVVLNSTASPAAPSPTILPTLESTNPAAPATTPFSLGEKDAPVVISEVMAGIQGNNNFEFIELYNRSDRIIDLRGWSIWYRLVNSTEDLFVYRWQSTALIPPYGHYLLGFAGQSLDPCSSMRCTQLSGSCTELSCPVDSEYEQAMNTTGGGLQLRLTDGTVLDSLSWGKAPKSFGEGAPAPALQNGFSLERLPGGEQGNVNDQNDNAADFMLNQTPRPQNTGSPLTPWNKTELNATPGQGWQLSLDAPSSAQPGSQFTYTLTLSNHTGQTIENAQVIFPLHDGLSVAASSLGCIGSDGQPDNTGTVCSLPESYRIQENAGIDPPPLSWQIASLAEGAAVEIKLAVDVPWTYFTALAHNYYATAENWPSPAFGSPQRTDIEGGVIPIRVARTLPGAELTVEGIATMYTGGFFSGTGNNKFYLSDETGGLQVYVVGGAGAVNVHTGARVRVRGKIELYRGAVEIAPITVPEDVQVLVAPEELPEPTPVTIEQALAAFSAPPEETLAGQLVQVEGDILRVEEFAYSYEIDLSNGSNSGVYLGEPLTLYVDKQTNINVEELQAGKQLRAIGLLEVRDTKIQLYPRYQSDLEEKFPPILRIEVDAPNSVQPGEIFTVTLTVFNHTPDTLTDVEITATIPPGSELKALLDGGERLSHSATDNRGLRWVIPQLAGDGASTSVHYQIKAAGVVLNSGGVVLNSGASSADRQLTATGPLFYTFVGSGVPVWAIQGETSLDAAGWRSPYAGDFLTTEGIVTGIFPELGGFWIQDREDDDNPLTSEGLFVAAGDGSSDGLDRSDLYRTLQPGDLVQVTGKVREPSQQTTLQIAGPQDVVVLSQANPLPQPVDINPPFDLSEALAYYEALEGMFVQVRGPALVVAPITKYGEYALVLPSTGINRLLQGEVGLAQRGAMIMGDDGSSVTHLDGSTLPYAVRSGDLISGLIGPLAYTYDQYKIEPIALPDITSPPGDLPTLAPAASDEFSIMTWNTENLFDPRDPHPTDPPKPRLSEYQRDLEKVAQTILSAGAPTIVALQEVENLGVLEDLAAHPLLAGYDYQPILLEGSDSRGIDVGYLVRGDRATVLDVQQRDAPAGLTSRPPLIIKVEMRSDSGSVLLYVINNHFTSMSGGEASTEGVRTAQAAWNVTLLQEILAELPSTQSPEANVAILGDLNSYLVSPPIDTLRQAGLLHVLDTLPPEERYTYIYQGVSQVLDHILITPSLMELLERVEVLHINADYPLPLPENVSPLHKSDHDPIVATFKIR